MCIFPRRNCLYELQHFRTKWLFLRHVKVIRPLKDDLIHHSVQEVWKVALLACRFELCHIHLAAITWGGIGLKITSFELLVFGLETLISQLGNVRATGTWREYNPVAVFMMWWNAWINLSGSLNVFLFWMIWNNLEIKWNSFKCFK